MSQDPKPHPLVLPLTREALAVLDALTDDQILEEDDHWQLVANAFAIETSDRNNPEDARALARFPAGRAFMRRMVEEESDA